jgi:PIN domain nuclease of toxin-antitoxin system
VSHLVDTHYLIWSLLDPAKIKKSMLNILLDANEIKFVSKISFWEISLKYSLGKLELKGVTPEELIKASIDAGYELLDLSAEDLATSYQLPGSKTHKDPFDRLLVWQCIRNRLAFITADERIAEYVKYGLTLANRA